MALERNLNAVPPVLLTANGSTEGVVQVVDSAGFYVKARAILQAPLLPPLTVEIKRVVSSTILWVGPPSANMGHRIDCSAYTVAAGSFIFAEEQPKAAIAMETRMLASYEQEPIDAWRTKSVDQYGNGYTALNPLPVLPTNLFFSSMTLGALGIPTLVTACLNGLTYDTVTSSVVGNVETISVYSSGVLIDTMIITYSNGGWSFECVGALETDYLLLENGNRISLEDGSGNILLE